MSVFSTDGFVPYDQGPWWAIQDEWFAARGQAAWTEGELPYRATSSWPVARGHARLIAAAVAESEATGGLGAKEPIVVLEIGSGPGAYAENLLRAFERDHPTLAPRLRYVMSDLHAAQVREAQKRPALQALVDAGRLIPAVFDVRTPDVLVDVDGRRVDGRIFAVLCGYVVDVSPLKILHRANGAWWQKYVYARLPLDGGAPDLSFDWRPLDPDQDIPTPQGDALRDLFDGFDVATTPWPYVFLAALGSLASRGVPGGLAIIADYGTSSRDAVRGHRDCKPRFYGSSVSHGVDFAVFDAFAARAGLGLVRTHAPLRSVHVAVVRFGPSTSAFDARFRHAFGQGDPSELLVDLRTAALQLIEKAPARAARLLERCVRLDPFAPDLWYRYGQAQIDAGQPRAGLRALKRGQRLDPTAMAFDDRIGRGYVAIGATDKAIVAYEAALAAKEHPITLTALAELLFSRGDVRRAHTLVARAVELAPRNERAVGLLATIELGGYVGANRRPTQRP